MDAEAMKKRTRDFALKIIALVEKLPPCPTTDIIGRQLLKSGTSPGANYRAACRAKSKADFVNKLKIVEEETDESIYWMDLLVEAGFLKKQDAADPIEEADEILSIIVSSIKTSRGS